MNTISEQNPFVSVVMPVRNEAAYIERSLAALLRQTYPADRFEIVVADGMSGDGTREIIAKLAAASPVKISIVDNAKKIAPTGLNAAIAAAHGEIVVRVDGHCEVETDYIANCVAHLRAGTCDGVGGPITTIGETLRAEAIAAAMSSRFGVGGSAFRTIDDREMYTDTVAFPGYTREIIDRAGPFNEELVRNQDDEYNFRIRKLGGRILLAPDIRSRYYSRGTFKKLWRQYFQYGYWKVRVLQLHPRQMSPRQFVPGVFVAGLLLLAVMAIILPLAGLALAAVLSLYLAANLASAVKVAGGRRRMIPLLALSFAILHVSYGLGFLYGLAAFAGNWLAPRKSAAAPHAAAEIETK